MTGLVTERVKFKGASQRQCVRKCKRANQHQHQCASKSRSARNNHSSSDTFGGSTPAGFNDKIDEQPQATSMELADRTLPTPALIALPPQLSDFIFQKRIWMRIRNLSLTSLQYTEFDYRLLIGPYTLDYLKWEKIRN